MLPWAKAVRPYRLNLEGAMIIREMTIDDYDEVYRMWQITTKRALSKADERDQMERYSSTTPV